MRKNQHIANQARILTALVLTSILSVGSGLTLIKSATANPASFSATTTNEVYANKNQSNGLPTLVTNAVFKDVVSRNGISTRELQVINYSRKTWRNGCLDLPQPNEFCTQALVPGWLVVVSNGEQKWTYHTNNNGRSLRLASGENQTNTAKSIPIPANELPPPLDQGVVFRQISSGGFAGRTYQTVLLNDGRLIRVRIGDANDSERSVKQTSRRQLRQFQNLLKRTRKEFDNRSYPAPRGAADFITYTLTSRQGTVQYNDISQSNLPQDLQQVITAWNQLLANSQ
ncbi:hypothetical protein ACX27_16150 [Nostoc piscinale CENA21]|uniref:Uncharacterized protein n=1 Tax=Nostoc piscinale CENA21 TaxID=224013 RepID=A0A0M4SWS7_9NOSO|nr:hypothetical protein [Nostoc piscinale]ALF56415.1 hypothetical protein ACX27_16150 [Nostoc piscinale CENA21]